MAGKIQLQQAFQKTYELPLLVKNVLYPVFANRVKIYQSHVIETNRANSTELRVIKTVKCYGQIDLDDESSVKCYEIILNPGVRLEYNKVSIQQYVRKLLTAGQAILVNFQQPEDKNLWRLSLVASDSKIIEDKIEQVKTNAKRYTYLLGPSETCRTASERFAELEALKDITIENLIKAFSVEKLSKSFFDEYKLHYQSFNNYLINSNFRSSAFSLEKQKDENAAEYKPIRDFVKKMLGRIVFLYFVQKKGWLAASTIKYTDGDSSFIMNLFMNSGANETFYPNYLCKLFFEALNTQRTNDLYTISFKDGKKEVVCVPFLNGGLFEKEKFDNKTITFPANLFHNKANDEDPKHRGFLDFLNAFNFTIYEDSPDDHTVAVDPEMLGHIFENLLEDNKDKGAYYTPKEIVHYMCQESLIEYLNTKLNVFEVPLGYTDKGLKTDKPKSKPMQLALTQTDVRDNIKRQEIEDFVKNKNANEFIFKNAKSIDGYLDTVKICDPAIGSGAFPMGLMQEIFALKMVLHDFVFTTSNELFHLKDYDPQNYRSNVKLNIIQNSIYGVDIEHGAVDIARLRFWLSLIVDEQIPKALPNLDYKIVTGNSLVSKFDDEVIDIDWEVKAGTDATKKQQEQIHNNLAKLFAKQKQFFNYKGDKPKLQTEIRNLKIEVLISQLQLDKYKYGEKNVSKALLFEKTAKEKQQEAETTLQITGYDNAIKKLERLKQQPDKPLNFFDWKLNFPEVMNLLLKENGGLNETGFDIVIGNPPYVDIKGLPEADVKLYFKKFQTTQNRINLYSVFVEKSISFLNNSGNMSFIIPNSILMNSSYEKIRRLIGERINFIIKLPDAIFENAIVETIIFQALNCKSDLSVRGKVYPNNLKTDLKEVDFNTHSIQEWKRDSEFRFNIFLNRDYEPILSKVSANETKFFQVADFSLGITPYDKYRGHSEKIIKGKAFHSSTKIDKTYKPLISGTNITPYHVAEITEEFIKYGDWLGASREERFFTQPRLIVRQILSGNPMRIYCGYTESKLYFTQIGFAIIAKKEYSNYSNFILLAILNSKLINFYHNNCFLDTEKSIFQKILIANCKNFPLPKVEPNVKSSIENKVQKIIALKADGKSTDNLQTELDNIIYQLYGLTKKEIVIIENS